MKTAVIVALAVLAIVWADGGEETAAAIAILALVLIVLDADRRRAR